MIYSISMHTTVYQFWRFVYHHEQSAIDRYARSSLYTRSFCTGIKLHVGHFLWPQDLVSVYRDAPLHYSPSGRIKTDGYSVKYLLVQVEPNLLLPSEERKLPLFDCAAFSCRRSRFRRTRGGVLAGVNSPRWSPSELELQCSELNASASEASEDGLSCSSSSEASSAKY